jgi:hypothetical protein
MKIIVFQLFFFEQCSPIMEVNDIHSWHHDSRVTDDSDCESENDLRYCTFKWSGFINISRVFKIFDFGSETARVSWWRIEKFTSAGFPAT